MPHLTLKLTFGKPLYFKLHKEEAECLYYYYYYLFLKCVCFPRYF